MILKELGFLFKAQILFISDRTIWFKFRQHEVQVFDPHAGEFWTKLHGTKYTKFWAFWQKMVNRFWKSVDTILKEVPMT